MATVCGQHSIHQLQEKEKLPIICFMAKQNNRIVIFAVFKNTEFEIWGGFG